MTQITRTIAQTRALDVILAVLTLLVLWAIYSIAGPEDKEAPETAEVRRGTVVSTVSADGNLEPPQDLSLGFERGGRLVAILVHEGQAVRRGQVLARVEDASARVRFESARHDLESSRARLADTAAGETIAELDENQRLAAQARVAVRNAESELSHARDSSRRDVAGLRRAVARAQVGGERADLRTSELRLAQEEADVRRLQREADDQGAQGDAQRFELAQLNEDLAAARNDGDEDEANDLEAEINTLQSEINATERDESRTQSELDIARGNARTYTQDVDSDRAALRDALRRLGDARDDLDSGIADAAEQVDAARRSLRGSEAELRRTLAEIRVDEQGPEAADLAADRAAVARSLSALEDAHQELEDTVLRAPVDGVVGKVTGDVGEIVGERALSSAAAGAAEGSRSSSASEASADADAVSSSGFGSGEVIRLANFGRLQVTANFNETDAAKLRRGDSATISVDALPERKFPARVSSIEPQETVIDNVVTYEVTLLVDREQTGLRPGMTATAEVIADEADGVLTLPKSAVRSPAGANPTVTVVRPDGREEARLVVTGLEGDTTVEIVGGVGVGERVVRSATAPPKA